MCTIFEFFPEMIELVEKLALRYRYSFCLCCPTYLLPIKGVSPQLSFSIYFSEIKVDGVKGILTSPEALELGMIFISLRFIFEHLFCEEPLPPEGQQAFAVEVAGM